MLERFTEKSINCIIFAQDEANRNKHDMLYPLHLLLGIINLKSGTLARVMKVTEINSDKVKNDILDMLKDKTTTKKYDILPFSDEVKQVLDNSWDISIKLGTNYIGPEHIFLSLIQDNSVKALFAKYDTDMQRITSTIVRIISKKTSINQHPEGNLAKKATPKYFSISEILNEQKCTELISLAKEEMYKSGKEALGTEQILLSMLSEDSSLKEQLNQFGITYEEVQRKLSEINSRKKEFFSNEIFCTPKLYKSMLSAYETAKELGSANIEPEHIILGILNEKDSIAYDIIKDIYGSPRSIYEQIIKPIEKQRPVTSTILRLAKEEARRLSQHMVGTELILLGILAESSSIAVNVLTELGVTLKDARAEVEKILGFGDEYNDGEVFYTIRAKRLLEMAWHNAKKNNKQKIEPEHLLMAIVQLKDCVAMKVLENLGVDSIEIKEGIAKELKFQDSNA